MIKKESKVQFDTAETFKYTVEVCMGREIEDEYND
jgi:hypothetical protein